ncbi:MAG: hypothetical protein ACOC00_08170 [Halothiobacillaceae bacterium]
MTDIREIIEGLHDRGARLVRDGDRLQVTHADRLTDADRYKLRSHKPAILEALQARDDLVAAVSRETGQDLSDWLEVEPLPTREQLAGYGRMLQDTERLWRGEVPEHYIHQAHCHGCGPVWLFAPGEVPVAPGA